METPQEPSLPWNHEFEFLRYTPSPIVMRALISIVVFAVVALLGIYLWNPYGTATLDPRARILGITTYRVASRSMAPTLEPGELILAQTAAYRAALPRRGDLIVFRFPNDRSLTFLSRVAGLPKDRISLREGRVYINGEYVPEPYLSGQTLTEPFSLTMNEIQIPEGHLFILGDNRDNSNDSRSWGFLPLGDLIGRVEYIWMSPDQERIGAVD